MCILSIVSFLCYMHKSILAGCANSKRSRGTGRAAPSHSLWLTASAVRILRKSWWWNVYSWNDIIRRKHQKYRDSCLKVGSWYLYWVIGVKYAFDHNTTLWEHFCFIQYVCPILRSGGGTRVGFVNYNWRRRLEKVEISVCSHFGEYIEGWVS